MEFRDILVAHEIAEDDHRTTDVLAEGGSTDFSALLLSQPVLDGLKSAGFKRPSPVQKKAIPVGQLGFDMIVQAKSGTGKTCVFSVLALDAVHCTSSLPQVLVIAPTREIAVQIHQCMCAIGSVLMKSPTNLRIGCFIGGTAYKMDVGLLRSRCQIVIGTPGRLCQLVNQNDLNLSSIKLLVLDEADKLMEETYQQHVNWLFSQLGGSKQVTVFSATYPQELDSFLSRYMRTPTLIRLDSRNVQLLGIKQYLLVVPLLSKEKSVGAVSDVYLAKLEALKTLLTRVTYTQCMVYTNYLDKAEWLSKEMSAAGFDCEYISSGLHMNDRIRVMKNLKQFKNRLLISTDLTARGIDAQQVNLVVNFEVPTQPETYFHRIGRAGRFGGQGAAISLCMRGADERRFYCLGAEGEFLTRCLPENISSIPTDLCSNKCFADSLEMIDFATKSAGSRSYKRPDLDNFQQRTGTLTPREADKNHNGKDDTVLGSFSTTIRSHGVDSQDAGYEEDESGGRTLVNYSDMCMFDAVYDSKPVSKKKTNVTSEADTPPKMDDTGTPRPEHDAPPVVDYEDEHNQSTGSVVFYGDSSMCELWSKCDEEQGPDVSTNIDVDQVVPKPPVEWRPVYRNRPAKYSKRIDPGFDDWMKTWKNVRKWADTLSTVYRPYCALSAYPDSNNTVKRYDRTQLLDIGDNVMDECFNRKPDTASHYPTSSTCSTQSSTATRTVAQKLVNSAAYQKLRQMAGFSDSRCVSSGSPTVDDGENEEDKRSGSAGAYPRDTVIQIGSGTPNVFVERLDPADYRRLRESDILGHTLDEAEWMNRHIQMGKQKIADAFKSHYDRDVLLTLRSSNIGDVDLDDLRCRVPELITGSGTLKTQSFGSNPWQSAIVSTCNGDQPVQQPASAYTGNAFANPFNTQPQQNQRNQNKQQRKRGNNKTKNINTDGGILTYSRRDLIKIRNQQDVHGWRALAKEWFDTLGVGEPFVDEYRLRCPYQLQRKRRLEIQRETEEQFLMNLTPLPVDEQQLSGSSAPIHQVFGPDLMADLRSDANAFREQRNASEADKTTMGYSIAAPSSRLDVGEWEDQVQQTSAMLGYVSNWMDGVLISSLNPVSHVPDDESSRDVIERKMMTTFSKGPGHHVIKYNRGQMLALWQETVIAEEPVEQEPWYETVVDNEILVQRNFGKNEQTTCATNHEYDSGSYNDEGKHTYEQTDDATSECSEHHESPPLYSVKNTYKHCNNPQSNLESTSSNVPDELRAYHEQLIEYHDMLNRWHVSCQKQVHGHLAASQLRMYINTMTKR